jgi:chromosome segregation protein
MQLTSLVIRGFKSFAEKTEIRFDEGITAIVGPNGCGKSNVVDAIRWVLGEQKTRMLRSEKMENIIFNGTNKRRASNLAEVSLTFQNTKNILPTEFSEVTITRKYYRTGDSEYRINDVPCRLKDITNLFLDTGIGSDSYAIIELGMVDEILNNKENARRNLIEEAAGVAKYKIRKKQTFQKLKGTEEDLSRVEDLLYEIEGNLKTLENQAKKAKRYYKLKDDYKEASAQLATVKVSSFKEKYAELEREKELHDNKKIEVNTLINKLESELQKEKLKVITLEKNLSIQQKATNDHIGKIRNYESEKKVKNERLRFLREREQNLNHQLDADRRATEDLKDRLRELSLDDEQKQREFDEVSLRKDQLQSESVKAEEDFKAKKQLFESQQKRIAEIKENLFKLEKEIDVHRIQKESLNQELARNFQDVEGKEEELNSFSATLSDLTIKLEGKEENLANLSREEESLQNELKKGQENVESQKDEITTKHRKLDSKQNEYNLTKSLVENLEGFPESIKFLRKSSTWTKNAPLLSDILFCEEEYRIPFENYLEPYMNYYVVETFSDATNAIGLLSDSSRGRANFFVLEAFAKYKAPSSPQCPEHVVSALSKVEVEFKYKNLIEYLLHNVGLVTDHEEEVIKHNKAPDGLVLITKSGKYTKSKFVASGGSVGLFEGKRIGRAKNLEKLNKEIKVLQKDIDALKNENEALTIRLSNIRGQSKKELLDETRFEIQGLRGEVMALKSRKEQYETFINNSKTRKEDILKKMEQHASKIEALSPNIEKLHKEINELQAGFSDSEMEYLEAEEVLQMKRNSFNELNLQFHQKSNLLESLRKDVGYHERQITQLEDRLGQNRTNLESTQNEAKIIVQNTDDNDDLLIEMYKQKEEMETGVNEAEEVYYKCKGDIHEMEEGINEKRRGKDHIETLVQGVKDRSTDLKIELNSLKERLSVEFGIDLNDILNSSDIPEEDETALMEKVLGFQKKLEGFGPVNPMAVEAFDEMNERYIFISTQRQDLLNAKDSLLTTIDEIDRTAREKFMDSFTKVKENFQRVFRSLFQEEDNCDLFLIDPSDPLESDIEIIAKPKGKRPLTINQLSGGEKTLTATALLFSLYLLKPAPFCIFDEVDAPLDDNNIDKFNSIIREFSKESQFIIVSHNKRTIASTDIIYGVTMIEQGISRVVPVDMREIEAVLE